MAAMVVLVVVLALMTNLAEAATYYVAKTGNDGNTCAQAQSTSTPKLTVQAGVNCATTAGDIVEIRTGTYNERVTISTTAGTVANPMTYQNYTGESPILDGTGAGAGSGITIDGADNVTIKGLEVRNYTSGGAEDACINLLAGAGVGNTSTTRITRNVLHNCDGAGNPASVKIQQYIGNIEIDNNDMYDNTGSSGENDSGVTIFMNGTAGGATSAISVHNNECHAEGVCYRYKHASDAGTHTATFEKNIARDLNDVSQVGGCFATEQPSTIIRYNICYNHQGSTNDGSGMWVGANGGGGTGNNTEVYNNCFYNVGRGIHISQATGVNVHDNIFSLANTGSHSGTRYDSTGNTTVSGSTTSMNYDDFAANASGREVQEVYSTVRNLAFLQALSPTRETNGGEWAAGYVNPPTDFHLTAGSSNQGAGTGGLDIGCYPTETEVIGIDNSGGGGGSSSTGSFVVVLLKDLAGWLHWLPAAWGLWSQRMRMARTCARAYARAGQATFNAYWRWKVQRWLNQAPLMLEAPMVRLHVDRIDISAIHLADTK